MLDITGMFIERVPCEYVYYQLIPTKSNRNNKTELMATWINKLHKPLMQQIFYKNKKLIIYEPPKVSFYIHITKHAIKFYFIVPTCYAKTFCATSRDIWKNIEIREIDDVPINDNTSTSSLAYVKDETLSLAVDKRNNDLP